MKLTLWKCDICKREYKHSNYFKFRFDGKERHLELGSIKMKTPVDLCPGLPSMEVSDADLCPQCIIDILTNNLEESYVADS